MTQPNKIWLHGKTGAVGNCWWDASDEEFGDAVEYTLTDAIQPILSDAAELAIYLEVMLELYVCATPVGALTTPTIDRAYQALHKWKAVK